METQEFQNLCCHLVSLVVGEMEDMQSMGWKIVEYKCCDELLIDELADENHSL